VAPVPLVGDQSFVGDWAQTLERLRALKPSVIVPGHGPVMRDDSYVRSMVDLLAFMKREVDAAAARGETLEQTRKSVNLSEFRMRFAGDSGALKLIFGDYVEGAGVAKAYTEATAKP
jgi:glyoxylase-like metal-dependent hydrolase (beta-lactamase superfamily II)